MGHREVVFVARETRSVTMFSKRNHFGTVARGRRHAPGYLTSTLSENCRNSFAARGRRDPGGPGLLNFLIFSETFIDPNTRTYPFDRIKRREKISFTGDSVYRRELGFSRWFELWCFQNVLHVNFSRLEVDSFFNIYKSDALIKERTKG